MMDKIKVALLGATGETGTSILDGLEQDGSFVSPEACKHNYTELTFILGDNNPRASIIC